MKLILQRVTEASVVVDGNSIGAIGQGLLVFVGIGKEDTKEMVEKMYQKMINLRIFADNQGKTNLSLQDVGGQLLIISQFTLYANCKKGNRPSFIEAASPAMAEELYEYLVSLAKREVAIVEHGQFGADMKVSLCNDGPFTIVLDSEIWEK